MPCNSEHMAPTGEEIEGSRVMYLLDELRDNRHVDPNAYKAGMHPLVYGRKFNLDTLTSRLCHYIGKMDGNLDGQSLELQLWWRDHQEWDELRERQRTADEKRVAEKVAALEKLTARERFILGLSHDEA